MDTTTTNHAGQRVVGREDLLELRAALAEERESQAVVKACELALERERGALGQRQQRLAAVRAGLCERYGLDGTEQVDGDTGAVSGGRAPEDRRAAS